MTAIPQILCIAEETVTLDGDEAVYTEVILVEGIDNGRVYGVSVLWDPKTGEVEL